MRVHVKVVEGEKERTQVFEGVIIGISGAGTRADLPCENFLRRRRRAYFPDPFAAHREVEVMSQGKVRRAKLYYSAGMSGKAARLTEQDRESRGRAKKA